MRMCGKHTVTGCIPMCLYTKKSVWEDIRKGYWLQEDIIKSAGMADPGLMYPTWMEQIAMEKGKLPKRKLAQRSSDKVKVAKTGEGVGMSLADFTAKVVAPPIVSGEEEKEEEKEEEETEGGETEFPEEEFIRLSTKMFPKWANDDSNIGMFMAQIDPEYMYTNTEMKELTQRYNKNILNLIKYENKSRDYGMILKKTVCGYQLYPILKNAYNLYF